jgi:hypothetical protein
MAHASYEISFYQVQKKSPVTFPRLWGHTDMAKTGSKSANSIGYPSDYVNVY